MKKTGQQKTSEEALKRQAQNASSALKEMLSANDKLLDENNKLKVFSSTADGEKGADGAKGKAKMYEKFESLENAVEAKNQSTFD